MFSVAAWKRLRLACARFAARRLFTIATANLQCVNRAGISVYYNSNAFTTFLDDALTLLQREDELGFLRLRHAVNAVVELNGRPDWADDKSTYTAGFQIGVYFDEFTPFQRDAIGSRRYAASLVGFATRRKIASQMSRNPAWTFSHADNLRILTIARKKELRCCELIGCEMKHIYNMQRLLRSRF